MHDVTSAVAGHGGVGILTLFSSSYPPPVERYLAARLPTILSSFPSESPCQNLQLIPVVLIPESDSAKLLACFPCCSWLQNHSLHATLPSREKGQFTELRHLKLLGVFFKQVLYWLLRFVVFCFFFFFLPN